MFLLLTTIKNADFLFKYIYFEVINRDVCLYIDFSSNTTDFDENIFFFSLNITGRVPGATYVFFSMVAPGAI